MQIRSRIPPLRRQVQFLHQLDSQAAMWNSYGSPAGPRLATENGGHFQHHHLYHGASSSNFGHQFEMEPSSLCLRAMVDDFIENMDPYHHSNSTDSSSDCCHGNLHAGKGVSACHQCDVEINMIKELDRVLQSATAGLEEGLRKRVMQGVQEITGGDHKLSSGGAAKQRWELMEYLRKAGYDAGICKSEGVKGLAIAVGADGHEFVDIVMGGRSGDVVVDMGFKWEFEIARPSDGYKQMLGMLPETYVGSAGALQAILRLMCHAARASLQSRGMEVPPWRRLTYIKAKWFSPYSRLTAAPAPPLPPPPPAPVHVHVSCPPRYTWRPPSSPTRRRPSVLGTLFAD